MSTHGDHSQQALDFLYHHVFLPPELPQKDDFQSEYDIALMQAAKDGLSALKKTAANDQRNAIAAATALLSTMRSVHASGDVQAAQLVKAFRDVSQHGTPIALHIRAQNAGVFINKTDDQIQFDVFELSPKNEAVMATKGRLHRTFPAASVSLSIKDFGQTGLQQSLAQTLSSMSTHAVAGMKPQVRKAQQLHDEDRDTTHPGMVTEVLMGFLSAVGKPVTSSTISKNTRDEVRFEAARSPWRRSATWLLIRVVLQLTLLQSNTSSSTLYKEAMLCIMCRIEELAIKSSFSSDALYVMNAKIAQRVLKIGNDINARVLQHVHQVTGVTQNELKSRWAAIREQSSRQLDLATLTKLDFYHDTLVSLPSLDRHIHTMEKRQSTQQSTRTIGSPTLADYLPGELPSLDLKLFKDSTYALANLHGFEDWVASHCRRWAEDRPSGSMSDSIPALVDLIKRYHSLARSQYAGNPEALSTMVLTIFELWVTCDEGATAILPLLDEYNVGINQDILQNLLLPFKNQMDRLYAVEKYLQARTNKATLPYAELFINLESPTSFAVKYFDTCTEQQTIRDRILKLAAEERLAKVDELEQKQREYARLMDKYNSSECQYQDVVVDRLNNFTVPRHRGDCKRCRTKSQASNMDIKVHEWPLPSDNTKAKAVIFELHVPQLIALWREATLFLVKDVLSAKYSGASTPRASYDLRSDQQLKPFSGSPTGSYRCTLLSEDKPHLGTHRKLMSVSMASEHDVCKNNGLNYKYYDTVSGTFLSGFVFEEAVATTYTYHLPKDSKALQKYIFRPRSIQDGPPPNAVIANQADCPKHMSLDEFKELASVSLGHRLGWYNLLLNLSAPTIDFRKDETVLVVLQCIYQAGPAGTGSGSLRASHDCLRDELLAQKLVDCVDSAVSRVKDNWESAQSLSVFSAVIARLISLTDSELIRQRCVGTLREIRNVAFGWMSLLRSRAQEAESHDNRTELQSKSVDVALICGLSFDVDDAILEEMLCSDENASVLVQCSIVIQEAKKGYSHSLEPVLALLSHRFRKLLKRSCTPLCRAVSGLDDAIKQAWPTFQPTGNWTPWPVHANHWVFTGTTIRDFPTALIVHYNTLTGELLVNGLPLDRPPKEYEKHPQWQLLFGKSAIEVMPTVVPGMQFSLKHTYKDYEVHVGIDAGEEQLVVRASKDGETYTTIPTRLLDGIFPTFFVRECVHWYSHQNDTIEFRPIRQPWSREPAELWILSKENNSSRWRLTKQGYAVIRLKSMTAQEIGTILQPLSEGSAIQTILEPSQTAIEVDIPLVQLGFFLHSGDSLLQSREFRGMSVDNNQSLTTLSGFSNKLLLKPRANGQRMVLLAEGHVSYALSSNHVKVAVDRSSMVKVHPLHIDKLLGRLIDNGDLQCKLFLAQLHALTSSCLPDPLTGNTGTEQCLSILRSAAVRSFDQLSEQNVGTLKEIANLSPGRTFYPANERVMQTTSFSSRIGFLSQHNGMFKAVQSIFRQAESVELFYPNSAKLACALPRINEHLLERDTIRDSTFRTTGFGAEDHTLNSDIQYKGRGSDQRSNRAQHAHDMSATIYRKLQSRHLDCPMPAELLWAASKSEDCVLDPNKANPCVFKFDPRLVASGLDFNQWLALHRTLMSTAGNAPNKFDLMIWLSALAAFKDADLRTLQILALIWTQGLRGVAIPQVDTCTPSEGRSVSRTQIMNIIHSHLKGIGNSPERVLRAKTGEDWWTFDSRRERKFASSQTSAVEILADRISSQWPSKQVVLPNFSDQTVKPESYIDVASFMASVKTKFKKCFENLQLSDYFNEIQAATSRFTFLPISAPLWPSATCSAPLQGRRFMSAAGLVELRAPSLPTDRVMLLDPERRFSAGTEHARLSDVVKSLEQSCSSNYEAEYIRELRDSLQCLQKGNDSQLHNVKETFMVEYLLGHQEKCNDRLSQLYDNMVSHIRQNTVSAASGYALAQTVMQWPRISPSFLLQMLNRRYWPKLSDSWKKALVEYGLAVGAVQRSSRLITAARSPYPEDLVDEICNVGHTNWDPIQYPESLLLEIESGTTIRAVQEDIAAEMRNPSASANAVMQLNMGEGKSSVIVPMVATSLANKSQLVRVIVAKPQSKQMLQMLVSKLGGLIDRRVRLMPFSRSLTLSKADADSVGALVRDCMANGDVLLVQPEHILSFQLMVLECFDSIEKQEIGQSLLATQFFFNDCSRDIVDESDENFSTKFELIYTMGTQRQIEFSPGRWICIQEVLGLIRNFGQLVAQEMPDSVEITKSNPGGFPRLRILKPEAGERLVDLLASHICDTGIGGFPITRQPKLIRDAVLKYLVKFDLTENEIAAVENLGTGSFWDSAIARSSLLLLRGLLAGGILTFAFGQKRWRVNYGLVSNRTPPTQLAVPYRAKDNPTPRSEFSHPDVVLLLTSLSYYYDGLADDDIFTALKHLMRSDQADVEYGAWIGDAPNMPPQYRQLEGINVRDSIQCTMEIFPHLKFGKAVIDYFLANIVFPKAMKEFPYKLSASGWDIGILKAHPTTGFSGTNDSKTLLPLDVEHLDLPRQKHTNALVLNHTLDPQNSVCLMRDAATAYTSDAERLLEIISRQDRSVQVILDVGAQILELDNRSVAQRWLEMYPCSAVKAVVYVNDNDELLVIDRKGHDHVLQTSSYGARLDECLVFLDEAHTRGIDLKLPKHYRAAVTLGANLTKDRLVQACMRMRKLGKGQTVVFILNPEIEAKIRVRTSKQRHDTIELGDVIQWAISETFIETRRAMPLWAVQGTRFLKQSQVWNDISTAGTANMSKTYSDKFLEPEAQSLNDRYRPKQSADIIDRIQQSSIARMKDIEDRCSRFDDLQFNASSLQEEQERELSPEIEQERQVERPSRAQPANHQLHLDVTHFITTGRVRSESIAYMPAFQALKDTAAAGDFKVSQLDSAHLLVSADFARTIVKTKSAGYRSDSYQRAVQFVLANNRMSAERPYLMIVSPYEAERLLSNIKASKHVALHLYKPRCNIGYRTFDRLDFFSIPTGATTHHLPRPILLQLDIFAGQLYLNSHEDYLQVCALLGLAADVPKDGEVVAADGFIIRDNQGLKPGTSPVKFLEALMSKIRRNGQGIGKTDMGYIMEGKLLEKSHFKGRV